MMKKTLTLLLVIFALPLANGLGAQALEYKGRLNLWGLYVFDDLDITSVIDIYTSVSPNADACRTGDGLGDPDYTVIGKDRRLPEVITTCNNQCCRERVIRNGETIVERVISNPDGSDNSIVDSSDKIEDTFITNLGTDTKISKGKFKGRIKGNLTGNLMGRRTTYGSDKYRYRFTDVYGQYLDLANDYQVSIGRKAVSAGVLVDGVDFDHYFGSSPRKQDKSFGAFAGLAPDPISKHVSTDRQTVGAKFHFIPEFSSKRQSKLVFDASLVSEIYKSDLNRLYLFSSSHFAPTKRWALFYYSTVALPSETNGSGIDSNYFTLQGQFRPDNRWFFSAGFSQFRIDRYLKEESVKWVTDPDSFQTDRVGTTLDRSHIFRFDGRISYKPFYYLQGYGRARYERRTIDSNKKFLNADPSGATPIEENLSLLNNKDAYRLSLGGRTFIIGPLETDTRFTFNERFLSNSYDIWQSATWTSGNRWTADAYIQVVWSSRKINNSVSGVDPLEIDATDFYGGAGGSYKIRSDLFANFRYDYALEDDYSLDGKIEIHSFLGRLDYRF